MAKLHETLAVESSLKQVADKLLKESIRTMSKESLFTGMTRRLEMFDEEAQAANLTENQELTTTVDANLKELAPHIARYWDAVAQKDVTNLQATADISVDNITLATDVPATFLLGLESKLNELRKLYEALPTYAPGIKWIPSPSMGDGVFETEYPEETIKTEKEIKPVVLYEATKEHPAQVDRVQVTKPVGKYVKTSFTGMLTPAEKAARLDRLDKLRNAVKKARQRANNTNVVDFHIGKKLLDYINQ